MQIRQRTQLNILTTTMALATCLWLGFRIAGAMLVTDAGLGQAVKITQPNPLAPLSKQVVWAMDTRESTESDWQNRFRLAGTFQTYSFGETNAVAVTQLAIVDDIQDGVQRMLREGDRMKEIEVIRIQNDLVVLAKREEQIELRLEGENVAGAASSNANGTSDNEGSGTFENSAALEITPFGKKIAANQWVIQRARIEEYVNELMQNPVRGAKMIQSMRPDRVGGEIAGFQLDMQGEEEFFRSMGMQNGDTIRKVNSMPMKNARRANYMIQEFMKSNMSAVVLDIERDGNEEKLIYVVR